MAVTITLSSGGATGYTVKNYDGNVVASGSVSGTVVSIPTPVGGWLNGWYRVYFTGPNNDAVYGNSYGATNFLVIPSDSNFPTIPASTGTPRYGGFVPSGTGATDAQAEGVGTPADGGVNQYGYGFDSPVEMITRACLGIGIGRLSLIGGFAGSVSTDDSVGANTQAMTAINDWWLAPTKGGILDPVRTRYQFVAFPNWSETYDVVSFFQPNSTSTSWINVCAATQALVRDATNLYVSNTAGTNSGTRKVTVYYPDTSTVVETFDNLALTDGGAAAVTTINTTSSYIRATTGGSTTVQDLVPTAIGNTNYTLVKNAVATLYPLGITHYEGWKNEPFMGVDGVQYQRLMSYAVHDGNASAKIIGPCPVNITNLSGWQAFLDAGGGSYCDEFSFHSYNSIINNDCNLGRSTIEAFIEMLATYGLDTKPMWQTEATHSIVSVAGVYMPRRARIAPSWWILWQQYGIPHEKNPYWYDWSHGFWGYPSMMFGNYSVDKGPNPQTGLMSTLARETYGKAYHHRVDFGSVAANAIFLGSVYGAAAGGSTMVLSTLSYIPSSSVTLTIAGTLADITVVDAWGNTSTAVQSSGRITVNVSDIPTYVRLPAGVNATVYSVNDWGASPNPNIGSAKFTATIGTKNLPSLADGLFISSYNGQSSTGINVSDVTTSPDTVELKFYDTDTPTVDRVIVWCGPCYQNLPVLVDYDLQTWDGTTWTTQVTVTKTDASSYRFGANSTNSGCEVETFWKEQWIEDIKLPSPVACKGVRLYVRQLSYGGAPDSLAANVNNWHGDSALTPQLAIQDIAILSSSTFTATNYATTVEADSPYGYWRLSDTTTTATSEVNSPTVGGTYSGAYTQSQPSAISDSSNNSVAFGNGGMVTVPYSTTLNVADTFTFECWYKPTSSFSGQFRTILTRGNFMPKIDVDTSGHVRLLGGSQNGTVVASSSSALSVGVWHHIVVTKSGATTHIYINGVDVTTAGTNVTFGNLSQTLVIGGSSNETIDEVSAYSTVLSAATVLAHYKAGSIPGAPANNRAPSLEGTAKVGDQVRCLPGRWTPAPNAFGYQWQSAATSGGTYANIVGATSSTYTLTSGESTKYVRCQVTGSTVGGTSSAVTSSNVIGPVA